MVWRATDPTGGESLKIRHRIVQYTRNEPVLDLGCGPEKAWPHFIGVDIIQEYIGFIDPKTGEHWRPDVFCDVTKLALFADQSVRAVFSSHLLEHLGDTVTVLREWWRVLADDGHLILYLPHRDLYPRMGEDGSNPDHKHDFHPDDIIAAMTEMKGGWDLVENETRAGGQEYSFFQVYKKIKGSRRDHSWRKREQDKRKRCLVIRYGGIGDMIQAASVLPGLREQGYRITLNTIPQGHDVLLHDPNIDEFIVQNRNQVPMTMLSDFWAALGADYDKVVNLSESVEGLSLLMPGRRDHALPQPTRHMLMNANYLDVQHSIAGVPAPLPIHQRFYATDAEREWARGVRKRVDGPLVAYCLMGSSVHKVWPHVAEMCAALFAADPKVCVVTLGGKAEQEIERAALLQLIRHFSPGIVINEEETKTAELCQMLRVAMGGGPHRLLCHAGVFTLRGAASLLEQVDCIVGPETGMMNIAAMLETPKVILMSHSSGENLTKYWTNTTTIESRGCPESPCHRMHYGWEHCHKDEATNAALCAAAVPGAEVALHVLTWLARREVERKEAAE